MRIPSRVKARTEAGKKRFQTTRQLTPSPTTSVQISPDIHHSLSLSFFFFPYSIRISSVQGFLPSKVKCKTHWVKSLEVEEYCQFLDVYLNVLHNHFL